MSKVLPSILNVDKLQKFLNIITTINENDDQNKIIDEIHFDIMDGNFVEDTWIRLEDILLVKKMGYVADVHLMVSNPKEIINEAIKFGANSITIHYEIENLENTLNFLLKAKKEEKIKVGISLCPETDVTVLMPYLNKIDSVLIMSVHPGKGGQTFIEESYDKIRKLRKLSSKLKIIVDGGVNNNNIDKILKAGANNVVVGSYITKDMASVESKIEKLMEAIS